MLSLWLANITRSTTGLPRLQYSPLKPGFNTSYGFHDHGSLESVVGCRLVSHTAEAVLFSIATPAKCFALTSTVMWSGYIVAMSSRINVLATFCNTSIGMFVQKRIAALDGGFNNRGVVLDGNVR